MTDTATITRQDRNGQPKAQTITYDRRRRYVVSGSRRAWNHMYTHALPQSIDDLTIELGADVYERMEKDPQVAADFGSLKTGILAHGYRIEPCELPEDASDADRTEAAELAALCKKQLDSLEGSESFLVALDNLLNAMGYGNKVCELVWDTSDPSEWRLVGVSPKHRSRLAFVVDGFGKVLGFLVLQPGQPPPSTIDLNRLPANFVPREKFIVFSWSPRDGDPRGRSIYRAAYQPWWIKMQMIPEWLKYLSQFASPSVIGFTAPDATSRDEDDEDDQGTPEEQMALTLEGWANGQAAAFPHGAQVEIVEVEGTGGDVFGGAFDRCDGQITLAILYQLLATGTAKFQTNASTKTHQDVFDDVIAYIKLTLEDVIQADILKKIVVYNRGEQAARFTPRCSLGKVEQQDFAALATAIANLQRSGYIHPSQRAEIDVKLGLPRRPDEALAEDPDAGQDQTPPVDSDRQGDNKDDQGDDDTDDQAPKPAPKAKTGGVEWIGEPLTTVNEEPAEDISRRATALGAFIRAGYNPQDSLNQAGLKQMRHSGGVPITLKEVEGESEADPQTPDPEPDPSPDDDQEDAE